MAANEGGSPSVEFSAHVGFAPDSNPRRDTRKNRRVQTGLPGSLELGESEEDDPELAGLVTGEGAAGGDSGTEQLDRNDSRTSQSSVASGHGQLRRHPSILKVTPATIVPKLSGEKTPSLCTTIMGAMKALCCGPGKDKMPTVWLDEIAGGDDGGPLVDAASIGKMKSFMDHFASHGVEPTDAEAEALLRAIHDSDEATFVDTVLAVTEQAGSHDWDPDGEYFSVSAYHERSDAHGGPNFGPRERLKGKRVHTAFSGNMLMKNWNRPGAAFSELPRHVAIRSLAELRECMMLVRPDGVSGPWRPAAVETRVRAQYKVRLADAMVKVGKLDADEVGERNKLNAEIKGLQTELKLDTLTAPDFSPIIPDRAHREAVAKRVVELEPRWREPPSGGGPLADAGAVGAEGGHWEGLSWSCYATVPFKDQDDDDGTGATAGRQGLFSPAWNALWMLRDEEGKVMLWAMHAAKADGDATRVYMGLALDDWITSEAGVKFHILAAKDNVYRVKLEDSPLKLTIESYYVDKPFDQGFEPYLTITVIFDNASPAAIERVVNCDTPQVDSMAKMIVKGAMISDVFMAYYPDTTAPEVFAVVDAMNTVKLGNEVTVDADSDGKEDVGAVLDWVFGSALRSVAAGSGVETWKQAMWLIPPTVEKDTADHHTADRNAARNGMRRRSRQPAKKDRISFDFDHGGGSDTAADEHVAAAARMDARFR